MGGIGTFLVLSFAWISVAGSSSSVHQKSFISVRSNSVTNNEKFTVNHPGADKHQQGYRLPQNVKPVGYRLNVTTRLGMPGENVEKFQGRVEIDVIVGRRTSSIVVHSKNLLIAGIYITKFLQKKRLNLLTVTRDSRRDFLIFKRGNFGFEAAKYTIIIEYTGRFEEGATSGFYKSFYTNDDGEKVWYAVTDFEPTNARAAFPCFDEPSFRTNFNISITHYKGYTATSNTPNISISVPYADGMVTTTFEQTPKMSTYLVAFLVSNFESISNEQGNLRILARPNATRDASFALRMGNIILEKLNSYTKLPYSRYMKKLDQVAVDGPESTAAMENWGLVTYREEYLLVDEGMQKSMKTKLEAAQTISHEFTHQWFGNLITPKWWKYLWLSEGMATLFEYSVVEKIKPEWRLEEHFVVRAVLLGSLAVDKPTGYPLNRDVETPEEIESIFGSITYDKGAAIFRMMQHFLTEPVFQRGLQNYIAKKKESSVDSDDLFQLIDEVASKENSSISTRRPGNLKQIVDPWVNQAGYPLIKVTRNYIDNTVHFEQECFTTFGNDASASCKNIWNIPLNYVTRANIKFNDTRTQFWLTKRSTKVKMNVKPQDWMILNKQATGYYRINYDEKNWLLIINYLMSSQKSLKNIHALNRAQLYSDALALVKAGRLSYTVSLKLASLLNVETDAIVWIVGFEFLQWLRSELLYTKYYSSFEEYFNRLKRNIGDELIKAIEESSGNSWSRAFDDVGIILNFDYKNCSHDLNLRNLFYSMANENTSTTRGLPLIPCCIRGPNHMSTTDDEFEKMDDSIVHPNIMSDEYSSDRIICLEDREMLLSYLNITHRKGERKLFKTRNLNSMSSGELEFDFIFRKFTDLLSLNDASNLINFLESTATTKMKLNKLKRMSQVFNGKEANEIKRAILTAENKVQRLEENKRALDEWAKELVKKL
ncbi:hypothetical protein QAD02_006068 [Eretmocerus hayati]|uniref:Uncharacterized protein n=1 Tax=Eretmocerus hayati TaxID=131215 RepID=A0ACC2N112_9HYME|nr:hypothetical protein QAD02_006068 [Eretmocerus hayati]